MALQSQLPASLGSALTGLRGAAGSTSFDVASLIGGIDTGLGLTATDFIGEVDVTALDIVRALVIAQNTGAATDLETDAEIAGIVSLHASLTAGEAEARSGLIAMGEEGVQLHRAAVRLDTELSLEPDLLTGLGIGVSVAQIHLPIYAEIAGSTATLEQIGCNVTVPSAVAARFSTAATPLHPANGTSVAALYLGALPTGPGPINPADLGFADLIDVNIVIDLGLLPDIHVSGLTIQGRSMVTVGASMTESVTFTMADVAAGDTVRSFGSGTLVSSAANGLLSPENTEFRVKPGQSGLVSGLAAPVVNTLLASLPNRLVQDLAVPVDAALDNVLDSTGLQLGVGEISLIEHHCEAIQLVR